eukprot:gnl/TRDRNA2_/TRDRNA2_38191_c0_seq1.p1 gnl/TRDRNA2_/TRDRNA2_38191_c0~~gnl/TRDRNA2_/TRDRNA2_38191_c0_seq1.p1  ORF type:complete len:316 (+),score=93.33 gnl/TRDRNA2_/TRDRNA2_38191_c0_seq1:95-1042(+)
MAPKKAAASPEPPPPDENKQVEEPQGEILDGKFTFQDGATYEGEYMKKGDDICLHGEGWLISGPEQFKGLFEKGLYKEGKYTSCNGAVYNGSFNKNIFHGFGEYNWPDGRVYKGMWKDGLMHGRGQFSNFSFGADKVFKGFCVEGRFASSREGQLDARKQFLAEYGEEYRSSALAALQEPDLEVLLVPTGDEEDKPELSAERASVEEIVAGPFPDAAGVALAKVQAMVALLAEGASEKPPQVTVLEEREQSATSFDGKRLKREQLQHVGQAVEFVTSDAEPGALSVLVLANVCTEYDSTLARWKIIHYEEVPAAS